MAAYAKRKHNGETIVDGSGNREAVVIYVVQDANSASEALGAGGLPAVDSEHERGGMFLETFSVRAIEKGTTQWEVDCVYRSPSGSISPDEPTVRIDAGSEIQRVDTGINGTGIGTYVIWDRDKDPAEAVYDEDHGELYVDALVPTFEFEVTMPRYTLPNVALWFSLLTKVHGDEFRIFDLRFPANCVQYLGTIMAPISASPARYEITHRFRAGATQLPAIETWDLVSSDPEQYDPWGLEYCPLGYAWWTVPAKHTNSDGESVRYPIRVILTRMYRTANLLELLNP